MQEEIQPKPKTIARLEVEISVTKFDSKKSKPKLSIMKVSSQSISPMWKPKPLMSISLVSSHEILPKQKSSSKNAYQPNIFEACKLIYGNHQLTSEEAQHIQGYREWKTANGEPIGTDIAYKPSD